MDWWCVAKGGMTGGSLFLAQRIAILLLALPFACWLGHVCLYVQCVYVDVQ